MASVTDAATAALREAIRSLGAEAVLATLHDALPATAGRVGPTLREAAGILPGDRTAGNIEVGALFSDSASTADDPELEPPTVDMVAVDRRLDEHALIFSPWSGPDAYAGLMGAEERLADTDRRARERDVSFRTRVNRKQSAVAALQQERERLRLQMEAQGQQLEAASAALAEERREAAAAVEAGIRERAAAQAHLAKHQSVLRRNG